MRRLFIDRAAGSSVQGLGFSSQGPHYERRGWISPACSGCGRPRVAGAQAPPGVLGIPRSVQGLAGPKAGAARGGLAVENSSRWGQLIIFGLRGFTGYVTWLILNYT